MLYIWFIVFLTIFVFALAYQVVSPLVMEVLYQVNTNYGSYINDSAYMLIQNLWMWLPVIFLICGVLVYVFVNSQKRVDYGYEY